MFNLDRKAMEAERLARLSKKRSPDPDIDTQRASKTSKIDSGEVGPFKLGHGGDLANYIPNSPNNDPKEPQGAQKTANLAPQSKQKSLSPQILTPSIPEAPANTSSLQYPRGIIKKTWAFGHERHNDIKIEEVLQRDTLRVAFLSSWQMDIDWITSKLDLNKTKAIFCMESKHEEDVSVACFVA